jgi:hypothetical protein
MRPRGADGITRFSVEFEVATYGLSNQLSMQHHGIQPCNIPSNLEIRASARLFLDPLEPGARGRPR